MQHHSTTNGSSFGLAGFLADLVTRNLEHILSAFSEPESVAGEPEPVKLSGSDVEALILECCERVKAMAWKFVRNASRLEFDELYSIGMLAVCEAAPQLKPGLNPFPYLLRAAKFAMIDEYRRACGLSPLSLDAPLSDDTTTCLGDIVSAPVAAPAAGPSEASQAVTAALLRLESSRQREALRRRFGLDDFGVCTLKETAGELGTTVAGVSGATVRGRHNLAHDADLCKVVGVEVAR